MSNTLFLEIVQWNNPGGFNKSPYCDITVKVRDKETQEEYKYVRRYSDLPEDLATCVSRILDDRMTAMVQHGYETEETKRREASIIKTELARLAQETSNKSLTKTKQMGESE